MRFRVLLMFAGWKWRRNSVCLVGRVVIHQDTERTLHVRFQSKINLLERNFLILGKIKDSTNPEESYHRDKWIYPNFAAETIFQRLQNHLEDWQSTFETDYSWILECKSFVVLKFLYWTIRDLNQLWVNYLQNYVVKVCDSRTKPAFN